ncbi:MAG: ATP-dependent helicase, partial [Burkholderiaceae bacterium]|nr:ATP-dependent helicase [Burkholderiaceae bacterium]
STQPLLDVSNAVIAQAAERHAKSLVADRAGGGRPQLVTVADDAGQARWVADRVLEHREGGIALTQQAVLFRTASHSAALELELARRNIPFVKFGGLKFLEAAHVKDLLAVLRFAQNPRGRMAGFRVLQLIPGIGPAHATRLLDAMDSAAEPLEAVRAFQPPPAAAGDWPAFAALYGQLRTPQAVWPADLAQAHAWYRAHLARLYDDAPSRQADLDNLERLAASHGSRDRFLAELTLDPPEATSGPSGTPLRDEDYLILSTIHSAKGQEWTSVHVLNAVDGCIPSDLATGQQDDIEEERRLLYVALTRARDHLQVLVPARFYITQQGAGGDRHLYASRSRFVPDSLVPSFDCVQPPQAPPPGRAGAASSVQIRVREKARAAWR